MNIAKREITAEKSEWLPGAKAVVEGVVKLPEVLEEISSVLEVAGQAELVECTAEEGKLALAGILRLTVLYMDRKGSIDSFDTDTHFNHSVNAPNVTLGMQAVGAIYLRDVAFKMVDSQTVSIKANLSMDLLVSKPWQTEIVDAELLGRDLEVKCQQMQIPSLLSAKSVKAYAKAEIRVPQSMPPVKRVLLARGYAVSKQVNREMDKVIVEGEIRVFVVYLSTDKNAPLQYLSETVPFGEIISQPECPEDAKIHVACQLEQLLVDQQEENEDMLDVSAVVGLVSCCYGSREVRFVEDLYSREKKCTLERTPMELSCVNGLESQKKVVRLGVEVPPSAPEVARVLYTDACPEIVEVRPEKDRVSIDGIMRFLLCYTTADAGVKSLKVDVPFETEVGLPDVDENTQVQMRGFVEYAQAEGSGRELEVKCCLDLNANQQHSEKCQAVSDVELGEEIAERQPGLLVYYADGGETLWDIAKRFKVGQETLKNLNAELVEPVPKGAKIMLLRA